MSPLQYAVMYKRTLALFALLELGYQVSETNHSAMATLFGPITHIINCQEIYLSKTLKTILFHPTYQPTKDLAELKSILEKLHFNSVRDLYGGYVNLNAENNVKFTADILFTLKLLTSTSPINSFTDFYMTYD